MLYSKHIQNSIRPQGTTLEQGSCWNIFSAEYNNDVMFTRKIKSKQNT